MKAKVIETGKEINVGYYTCPTYAVYDCNGQLKEIYDEDELEFEPRPKMVSLEKACEWLKENADCYTWYNEMEGESGMMNCFIEEFRKAME